MALFFDARWFDARLAARGLTRADAARVLGLDEHGLRAVWKDQREVTPRDVLLLAALLGEDTGEVASRSGVSTRTPAQADPLAELAQRVERLEAQVAVLETALAAAVAQAQATNRTAPGLPVAAPPGAAPPP